MGAIYNAPLEASSEGCGAFQVFVANSRSWRSPELPEEDSKRFREYVSSFNIVPFAHVPYLCNPSSSDANVRKESADMLADNMRRCDTLGIKYLVVHIGSHKGDGIDAGIKRAADTIRKAMDIAAGSNALVLLENGAGYANSVGSKMEEIGALIDKIGSEKAGLCLDTCHAFAAGYELRTSKGIDSLMELVSRHIGLDRLHLVHFNDSKYDIGSGLDRHWNIGKGYIGLKGLGLLLANAAVSNCCFIMETPITADGDHASDLSMAESLAKAAKLQIERGKRQRSQ
jgi:deoxyribonuclease-4